MKRTYIDPMNLPAVEPAMLRRIVGYVRPYWLRASGVVGCMAVGAALNLTPAWFVKRIVDDAIPHHNVRLLWICCTAMVVGPLAAGVIQVAQKYWAEMIAQRVMLDLRVALYRRLHEMPFSYFATQKPGEAVSHVLNDVQGVGGVVSGTFVDVVQNTIVLISTTAFVMALDWRLALVAVGFLPLFITPTRRVGRRRKALKRAVQARMSDLTGILTETLSVSGALLIKVSGTEKAEVRRFRGMAAELKRLALEQSFVGRWFNLLLGLFEAIGPAVVFALGGLLVIRGHVPLGTIVAFVALLKRLYSPASDLAGVHVDLVTSYAYFERVFSVLDRVPPGATASTMTLETIKEGVDLRGVSFGYDESGAVLDGIDLTIPAGSTVALVGPSGAVKSTLASLVMRLYDPTKGTVRIDGVDVRELNSEWLRSQIAVVPQDTFLFHTTILENLRYGNRVASRSAAQHAATLAQLHDVIAALPEGYDTVVGERGYRLSAGERQRVAIARAILKNPRILILDEATSSLDNESERQVQAALAPLLEGRTCLMIAHRLTTIRHADLIVVLDRGRIVQRGTHDELIARPGLYSWLWRASARDQRPRAAEARTQPGLVRAS